MFGCESGTTGQRMASQSEKLQKCGSYGVGLCCVLYGLIKCQNKEVLQRANTSRNLLKLIVNKQIRFVGHIMRKSQLEAIALTGMIEGKTAIEVDKGKRLWIGYHSLVGNNGRSTT